MDDFLMDDQAEYDDSFALGFRAWIDRMTKLWLFYFLRKFPICVLFSRRFTAYLNTLPVSALRSDDETMSVTNELLSKLWPYLCVYDDSDALTMRKRFVVFDMVYHRDTTKTDKKSIWF